MEVGFGGGQSVSVSVCLSAQCMYRRGRLVDKRLMWVDKVQVVSGQWAVGSGQAVEG